MQHPILFILAAASGNKDSILAKAEQMLQDGADILDIGGQSTRPGAENRHL